MDGCILWGARIIVPQPGREQVLQELHETPRHRKDEDFGEKLRVVAKHWCRPWSQSVDLWWLSGESTPACTGTFTSMGMASEAVVPVTWIMWARSRKNASSACWRTFKVLDVVPVSTTTSTMTIEKLGGNLRLTDYHRGLSRITEQCSLRGFWELPTYKWDCAHENCSISSGLAERVVQTFKQGIKPLQGGTIETKLSWFLLKYRLTPHTTTGRSPAELLLGRQPWSRLDLLHPDVSGRVQESQARQKRAHDTRTVTPEQENSRMERECMPGILWDLQRGLRALY